MGGSEANEGKRLTEGTQLGAEPGLAPGALHMSPDSATYTGAPQILQWKSLRVLCVAILCAFAQFSFHSSPWFSV